MAARASRKLRNDELLITGLAARRLRLELEAIEKGEVDIVIGTQLVAKGHNFPNMTCLEKLSNKCLIYRLSAQSLS